MRSYSFIDKNQWGHEKTNQSNPAKENESLYGAHLIISLVKRLIRGTFQGRFEPKYLQNYLDEYVFRFNRRKSKSIGKKFMHIVQQVMVSAKITYSEIGSDINPIFQSASA